MKISNKLAGAGLAAMTVALGALVTGVVLQGAARADPESARPDAPKVVRDFMLADQNLQAWQLHRLRDDKAVVLITYAAGDRQVHADAPAYAALQTAYVGKGVDFLMVDSHLGDRREKVIPDAKAAGIAMPILFDYEQLVGEALGVTRTAEVIVVDPRNWHVAYRGPVGGAGKALDDLMAGDQVEMAAQAPAGETIAFPERDKQATFASISYAHSIAPIIQQKCATCHQPGGIGPMPLNNYTQIKAFSPMINEVILTHRMPPYLADETIGKFQDDDRLSPDQMKTLVHWIKAGSPRGEGDDPLAKIAFHAPEWPLGKPDMVITVPDVKIAATGVMDYQHPVVANVMTEGRWMKATTFRISDRQVVHHILTGVLDGDVKPGGSFSEAQWGASLGGYGPGRGSNIEPSDTGVWIPASGAIGFQTHYTPYGRETTEKTQLGLYFYKKGEEPKYVLRTMGIYNFAIVIPAREERHHESAYIGFPHDAILYGLTPHAHHRGAATSVSVIYPDGREEMLLALPRYDFNWQYEYFLAKPLRIPAGSKVIARWTYDNSARNPGNPDPNSEITWGEQSSSEMLATYLHYRWVDETVASQKPDYEKEIMSGALMGMFDTNMDGKIEKTELKRKMGDTLLKYFDALDADHDGTLDAKELAVAQKMMGGRRGGGSHATAAPAAAPAPAPAPVAALSPAKPTQTASR